MPVMVVHGWQDYNVKQDEGLSLYDALPVDNPSTKAVEGVPFKKLWLTQSSHANGSGAGYQELVDAFWARTLKGARNGIERTPDAHSLGRTADGASTAFTPSSSWPPAGTRSLTLEVGDGVLTPGRPPGSDTTVESYVDTGAVTEEMSLQAGAEGGAAWLYHQSDVLKSDVRIAGSAVLDAVVGASSPSQQIDPLLVEVRPDGSLNLVERGFLDLDYRHGLAKADPSTGWLKARVRFLPQDYTFTKGSRIGLIVQSSNTVWAVPGSAGPMEVSLTGRKGVSPYGPRLALPVVGLHDPEALFTK